MGRPANALSLQEVREDFDQIPSSVDLVAFCHLRWNFVWQRPQHLMSRFAQYRRVFFIEEPIIGGKESFMDVSLHNNVHVVIPHLADTCHNPSAELRKLVKGLFRAQKIRRYILWYWTPMALPFSQKLTPEITVYDCMDDLSGFANPPEGLKQYEEQLMARAEIVFTGGQSLYEAKRYQHPNIHPFPSSIDVAHFKQARTFTTDLEDQKSIPHPRIGFYGVIDERMNQELLSGIAQARPDWHLVLIGPTAKIDPTRLPQGTNIHYLNQKRYEELPCYIAGWDVALLPFAINRATKFISPTKTPEYLAAGLPVVSSPIRDVVRPYGELGLVQIADGSQQFIEGIERALKQRSDVRWLSRVDAFLEGTSWDRTWQRMDQLMLLTWKSRHVRIHSAPATAYIQPALVALQKIQQEHAKDV
jgi:UDP-galactopyranose mutase